VLVNERPVTEAALRLLLDHGHRRIALVGPPSAGDRLRFRAAPIARVLAEAGAPLDDALVLTVPPDEASVEAVGALLALERRPTAIVALTHQHTPFVLQAVAAAGLTISGDVSLLVYGDSSWAAAMNPPLTVVRVDYESWGREAARLLMQRIDQPGAPVHRIVLDAHLVIRSSVGPVPASSGRR
jgi:LacI family transcriptional regulator